MAQQQQQPQSIMQQQQQSIMHQQQLAMMMIPSPAAMSSPSTGFVSSRASPLFSGGDSTPPPAIVVDYKASAVTSGGGGSSSEDQAPPKQLANALDGLGRAIRLIAEVRTGSNLLLEAVESADWLRPRDSGGKTSQCISKAQESTKGALEQLRCTGRELESAGVLLGAQQRYQDNQPWGLHTPLVCPDGTVVAYSWKRQIAGQAAASAVHRTRLALKAFTEQKKRFLPHIDDEQGDTAFKRRRICECSPSATPVPALPDVLKQVQTDCPGMLVVQRQRSSSSSSSSVQQEAAFLELLIPGILRAVVSLHPAPLSSPDALAVFSPDETGEHVHAWGTSLHNVYQRISQCGSNAIHYYTRMANDGESPLLLLLQWFFGYRTLFSKPCSQCRHLLALDSSSNLLLPPFVRPFVRKLNAKLLNGKVEEGAAYHCGCSAG